METYIKQLYETGLHDLAEVGGENICLEEVCHQIPHKGGAGMDGFVVTTSAFRAILSFNSMDLRLYDITQQLDKRGFCNLGYVGNLARSLFEKARIPYKLRTAIDKAYKELFDGSSDRAVTIKSCFIQGDALQTKFKEPSVTYPGLETELLLMEAIKKAAASLYSDGAIRYREEKGIPHYKMCLAIRVQKETKTGPDRHVNGAVLKPAESPVCSI